MSERALRDLSRGECFDLLRTTNVGQLVMTRHALPAAVPAHYLMHEDCVLIHIATAIEPSHWRDGDVVALHVSVFDADQRAGWTVSVTGRAHGTPELPATHDSPHAPWIAHGGGDLIELSTEMIHGERLGPPDDGDQGNEPT